MQTSHSANGSSPHDTMAALSQSLEKTLDQNRVLFRELAHFTKDESLRLVQRQLDHAGHALAWFDERRDFSELMGAQQEWIKDVMRDYADQSLRYAEMFRSLTERLHGASEQAASEVHAVAKEDMEDLVRTGEAMAHQVGQAAE
jgi:hypothetical protein